MGKEDYEYLIQGMEEELPKLVRSFRKGLFKLIDQKDTLSGETDKFNSIIIDFTDELMIEILEEVIGTYEEDISICKANGLDTSKSENYLLELKSIIISIEEVRKQKRE